MAESVGVATTDTLSVMASASMYAGYSVLFPGPEIEMSRV